MNKMIDLKKLKSLPNSNRFAEFCKAQGAEDVLDWGGILEVFVADKELIPIIEHLLSVSMYVTEGKEVLSNLDIDVKKCLGHDIITLNDLDELGMDSYASPYRSNYDLALEALGDDHLAQCHLVSGGKI